MKWLAVLTVVVLMMGVSGTAKASYLDHYFGGMYHSSGYSYYGGYGYFGGGIISELAHWQIENRKLDVAEEAIKNEQDYRHQSEQRQCRNEIYGVQVGSQEKDVEKIRLENQKLHMEIEKLKLEIQKLNLQLQSQQSR